jgi:hypothetical protein
MRLDACDAALAIEEPVVTILTPGAGGLGLYFYLR